MIINNNSILPGYGIAMRQQGALPSSVQQVLSGKALCCSDADFQCKAHQATKNIPMNSPSKLCLSLCFIFLSFYFPLSLCLFTSLFLCLHRSVFFFSFCVSIFIHLSNSLHFAFFYIPFFLFVSLNLRISTIIYLSIFILLSSRVPFGGRDYFLSVRSRRIALQNPSAIFPSHIFQN